MFLFLAAIIVIIATIYLGGKMYGVLTSAGCGASDADFKSQLKSALDQNSVFGSRKTVELSAPCKATTLCFIDSTWVPSDGLDDDELLGLDLTIRSIVDSGVMTNVFLRTEAGVMEAGYDPRISVTTPGYACFEESRGMFFVRIEGGGRTVTISHDSRSG